jgi:hypothetical protein
MNANEVAPKTNTRLQRIRTVSRIVKYAILGLFIFNIGFFLIVDFPTWRFSTMKTHPVWFGLISLPQVVLWVWYWKLARLFDFYESGLIFATTTIRCIKTLGILCVVNWLLLTTFNVWERSIPQYRSQPSQPGVTMKYHANPSQPGITIKLVNPVVVKSDLTWSFYSFSIAGISFGLLLAGAIIIIIAWVMDEGRKIQEEQELTV